MSSAVVVRLRVDAIAVSRCGIHGPLYLGAVDVVLLAHVNAYEFYELTHRDCLEAAAKV